MASATAPAHRRPRSPGLAYSVVTLAIVLLLAALALTARQPPAPTIAEFAPQAVDQITQAPDDQATSSGDTGRGIGASGTGASPEPAASPASVPRVRRCVGEPPRQIEDPQSPPCVPHWSGDNGGSTSKGVTRDEVRVVFGGQDLYTTKYAPAFESFFSARFELYGRRLRIINVNSTGTAAQAVSADEEHNAFAVVSWQGDAGYYSEAVKRQIVSVSATATFNDDYLSAQAPHVWQYPMATDRMFSSTGRWACARLTGRSARFAGDPTLRAQPRAIGVIRYAQRSAWAENMSSEPFERELRECGSPAVATAEMPSGPLPNDAANAVLQLKSAGATSIVCLCELSHLAYAMAGADGQGYAPEWIVSGTSFVDYNGPVRTVLPISQRTALFGVTYQPRQVRVENTPAVWAQREATGAYQYTGGWVFSYEIYMYQTVLLMASGIQMAGPRLTPQTFAQALHRTAFPNPPHPNMAGAVGFRAAGGRSHSMTIDAAEIWWDEAASGPYPDDRPGAYCYVENGARREPDAWPAGDRGLFAQPCNSGTA